MGYDRVEDLRIYQIAEEISKLVWDLVAPWSFFAKDTVGKQIVRSADSIGANIAEGYGRHHTKDNLRFLYIARGSLQETKVWLARACKRKLIAQPEYDKLVSLLSTLEPALNRFIRAKANMGG
jgi:four helix bundle protein